MFQILEMSGIGFIRSHTVDLFPVAGISRHGYMKSVDRYHWKKE